MSFETLGTLRDPEQDSLLKHRSHLLCKQMLLSKSHPTKSLLLDREIYDLSFTAQPGDEPCPKNKYENFSQTQARCSTEVHMLEQKTTDQNIIAAVIQHPHCNCL